MTRGRSWTTIVEVDLSGCSRRAGTEIRPNDVQFLGEVNSICSFWIVPWGSKTEEERGMKPNEEEVDSFLR
jgi:hypothetical protein